MVQENTKKLYGHHVCFVFQMMQRYAVIEKERIGCGTERDTGLFVVLSSDHNTSTG